MKKLKRNEINKKQLESFVGKEVWVFFEDKYREEGTIKKITEKKLFFKTKERCDSVNIKNIGSIIVITSEVRKYDDY
jgi:hypothetical protein